MSEPRGAQQETAGCLIMMLGLLAILVGVVAMLGASTGVLLFLGGVFLVACAPLIAVLPR